MKRSLLSLAAALLLTGAALPEQATAQRLRVHCGPTTFVTSAEKAGQMSISADGSLLQLGETTIATTQIDSITVDREAYNPLAIAVNYSKAGARLTVPCHLKDKLTITVDAGKVGFLQATDLLEEVTYTLSGTSANGSFAMDGEYKAALVLNGLTLTNTAGPAIDIANGKRINVTLPAGTTTTLTDGAGGLHKACFFINGHAEFDGAGTLVLTGNTKHAYASDEYTQFKPTFGQMQVAKAASDGLHIEQYLQVQGGTFTFANIAGDNVDVSITKTPTDTLNGQVFIEGGTLTLNVASDDTKGMKCDSAMTITGGTIKATVSGLGTKGISVGTDLLIAQPTTTATLIDMAVTGTTYMPGDALLESKCRGIKVKGDFTFDGGTIKISATGVKSKAISVDGDYTYKSGSINCAVSAANM